MNLSLLSHAKLFEEENTSVAKVGKANEEEEVISYTAYTIAEADNDTQVRPFANPFEKELVGYFQACGDPFSTVLSLYMYMLFVKSYYM